MDGILQWMYVMEPEKDTINALIRRYPELGSCSGSITAAVKVLTGCYENGGKLLLCGNGGSAADSSHIAGELMKGFLKKRELSDEMKKTLLSVDPVLGASAGKLLQGGLPAVPLNALDSLTTAAVNDIDGSMIFAQQVMALGKRGDILLGISTSGNADNVVLAAVTARAKGLTVIGLTGRSGGNLKNYCDVCITVPADDVPRIQELHLPVYHAVCALVEEHFFS